MKNSETKKNKDKDRRKRDIQELESRLSSSQARTEFLEACLEWSWKVRKILVTIIAAEAMVIGLLILIRFIER